jgi:hypothetical protein
MLTMHAGSIRRGKKTTSSKTRVFSGLLYERLKVLKVTDVQKRRLEEKKENEKRREFQCLSS